MKRMSYWLFVLVFVWPGGACAQMAAAKVTLDYVARQAEARAQKPFHSPQIELPEALRPENLNYDQYRQIRFRRERALWAKEKLPFEVEFFHPGYLYNAPVHLFEFTENYVQPVRFVQDFFDYGRLSIKGRIPADIGYAGFRILYPLNRTNQLDELGAVLGSYFRWLGRGQRYGQSARALALDCGEPDRPEEFPYLTDWWLGKPQPGDPDLRLFALLDSVSCAGAYSFQIRPGETTVAAVEAVVFFRAADQVRAADPRRKPLKTVGWAPLTSMFWFGQNTERKPDDYRPEVHDTDGLLLRLADGQNLWRPLDNPARMRHQVFPAPNLRGFGLLQRARDFAAYQDLFNDYQRVPSVWVQPRGDWGEGAVHLVELTANYEGFDNIVAFWVPQSTPPPRQPLRFAYTLYWTRETDLKLSENKVVATRVGIDPAAQHRRQFAIDFAGPKLSAVPTNEPPQAMIRCSANGTVVENQVFYNPFRRTWRVMLKLEPKAGNQDPIDLRCTLKRGEEALSETWTYLWSPP